MAVALAIRAEEGWPVKGKLKELAEFLEATPSPSISEAIRTLTPIWQTRLDTLEPRLRGAITKVIADGKAGFVEAEDGASYYFRSSELHDEKPEAGLVVNFRTAPGFDQKKNQVTTNAVDLRLEVED